MPNIIKVLLVDDERIIRVSLASLFGEYPDIEIVGEAQNGLEAVELAEQLSPDVILMDLGMEVMDGIKATKIIKEKNLHSKILVLTAHTFREDEVLNSLAAGADGYAGKDLDTEMLINIIRSVNKGAIWIDPQVAPIVREKVFSKIQNST